MKILIISGTPKTDGITYSFVTAAEETIAELGLESETLHLSQLNLTQCKMCTDGWGVCYSEHRCMYGDEDGFNALQEKVRDADAYIYISPVYWYEPSEAMKLFVDKLRRCQATKKWDAREQEVSFHKNKPSILVSNAGGGGGGNLPTLSYLERALLHMEGDEVPRNTSGIFDCITVNRWNHEYKLVAFKAAIKAMAAQK